MAGPEYALLVAVIWAVSPIYYRGFLSKFDVLSFNFFRTASASLVLAGPALYYWNSAGLSLAVPSGVLTLAVGDSLFLISLRQIGASVTTPVAYTYVLMVQFAGAALGQAIPYSNFLAAGMVVAGVFPAFQRRGRQAQAAGDRPGRRGRALLDDGSGAGPDRHQSGGRVPSDNLREPSWRRHRAWGRLAGHG